MLLLLQHLDVELLSVDASSMRCWVGLLSPLHVGAIHVAVGWNFDLESTLGFKLLHYFYRVLHKCALLHLVGLDLHAVVHDLARFCGNALSLSPR